MLFGAIKQVKFHSPLSEMAYVRPSTAQVNVLRVAAPLMLTSLVDAFAVIVIYLLVSTYQGADLPINKEISLPQAIKSKALEVGVNVRVANNSYIINEQKMNAEELLNYLTKLNKELTESKDQRKGQIIIQADKNSNFAGVSPLLLVAAQSGFENIKFAVMGE